MEYIEMHIDEMKSVKESWKCYFKMAKNNLKHIQNIEETKENRWELKSLTMSYTYFIDQISKIVKIYSELINLAEDCELEEKDFVDAMKVVQKLNNDLHIESNKKTFKSLNIKYIESLRPAKNITL
ncbi:MAG: hypothetical protein J6Q13_02730 [Clostridia bacterium]|nr:hypothetical protein [Clostridia bacterium]